MNKLPENFELDRYGLHVRLVREDDAEFIVALRTDSSNTQYLHASDLTVENQIKWIREYKKREQEGKDYYFVFEHQERKVGVARLYGMEGEQYTHGSWVFANDAPSFCAVASAIIAREIAFDYMGMSCESNMRDGTDASNKNVVRFQKMLGMDYQVEREEDGRKFLCGVLTKESFEAHKNNMLRFIPKEYQE